MSYIAINKKARFNYNLIKPFEAGVVLNGWEIKSIRKKDTSIKDAFVIIKKNEAFIINMYITPYEFSSRSFSSLDPSRTRKLLLHKSEIQELQKEIKLQKVVVIPTKVYLKNNYAKIVIFTAKSKNNYDKREQIKERDTKREVAKQLKNKY